MPFKMHRYEDGVTGLAAFCDTCGEQITERGYVVWRGDPETDRVAEWEVVHQSRCDKGRPRFPLSMPLDTEVIYLAHSAGIDLEAALERVRVFDSIG